MPDPGEGAEVQSTQALADGRRSPSVMVIVLCLLAIGLMPLLHPRTRSRSSTGSQGPEATIWQALPEPSGPKRPRASVLLVSVDAMRPDRMGLHGHQRPTTPRLDRWAGQAVVFERAYCQAPHTSFSIASLLIGQSLYPRGLAGHERRPKTIAELARRYGIKTGAFFPPSIFTIDGERLADFEEQRFGFEYSKYEHLDATRRVDQVLAFLDEYRHRQVLVWAHFFEPHEPYEQQPGVRFGALAADRYDSELALVDREVSRLIDQFRRRHPESIVVLTGDHGEELGECGGYYHGNSLSEPQVRVPLVVQVAGLQPRRVGGQARVVDVPVTLLSLLDIPVPSWVHGVDLGPWLAGRDARELPPAVAELDRTKMVVAGRHKLFCDAGREDCDLYDLEQDRCRPLPPARRPAQVVAALRSRLETWMALRFPPWRGRSLYGACRRAIARGEHLDTSVIPSLLSLCPWTDERRTAAWVLASMRSPLARPALMEASRDPDAAVRQTAVVGLELIGGPTVEASDDREASMTPALRRALLLARARAGDRRTTPLLGAELARTRDPYEAVEAIQALGELGDPAGASFVRPRLDGLRTRLVAIEALGKLRDEAAVPALAIALVEDRFISRRRAAALALAGIGGGAARAALLRALRKEIEPDVRTAITAGLRALRQVGRVEQEGAR